MQATRGMRATDGVLGAVALGLFVAGWALAAWLSIWAVYAWGARDESWLLTYGGVTVLALALPVAYVVGLERWQLRQGLHVDVPTAGLRIVSAACGSLAALLCLVALPAGALSGYLAWMFWTDGMLAASVYFVVVGLALLLEPVALLVHYDRWQAAHGLR